MTAAEAPGWRSAQAVDAPALAAFLARHPDSSMFLRAALAAHGATGGAHDHAARFWCREAGGAIAAVVALSTAGMLLVQAPAMQAPVEQARAAQAPTADLRGLAACLAGETVAGINGDDAQVLALSAALGLSGRPMKLDAPEPLCRLALSALRLPEARGRRLRRLAAADEGLIGAWRHDYACEVLGETAGPALLAQTTARIAVQRAEDTIRLLEDAEGRPLAITAFNATLPEIVQVGGVYTLPALRGQGHARLALGLHLAEMRAAGVAQAVLFASGPPALRAYQALGFAEVGRYRLSLLASPVVLPC